MEAIRCFIRVSEIYATSGQPAPDEFAWCFLGGVRLVVNLAMPDSEGAVADEQKIIEELGMRYVSIPVPFGAPTLEHFLRFEEELLTHGVGPVLVHCARNWRATSFMALFAERHLGWTEAQADELRSALWKPDEAWESWCAAVRALGKP